MNLLKVLLCEYFLCSGPPLLVLVSGIHSLHLLVHHATYHEMKGLIVLGKRDIQPASH